MTLESAIPTTVDFSQEIYVKYFTDIESLKFIDGKSDWIDLRAAKTVMLNRGQDYLIPLGVAIKLPEGYEALIAPRSSSFKHYGFLQTNSIGVIDETYCGNEDEWKLPIYATRESIITKGDRIAQFRIIKHQPKIKFIAVDELEDTNRGGFGSTGTN